MNLYVIRNKKQSLELVDHINNKKLPFKCAIDEIYPARSVDLNAYYWGVVLKYISNASGHDIIECHEGYKRKFNLGISFKFNSTKGIFEPDFGLGSTANMNGREFADFIFMVRCDGEMEHHIIIPFPNESFVPELDFEHDKIEEHRL